MQFTSTHKITLVSLGIYLNISYGPNKARMPIFGHTFFGKIDGR